MKPRRFDYARPVSVAETLAPENARWPVRHSNRMIAVRTSAQPNRCVRPARGSTTMHPAKSAQITVCDSLIRVSSQIPRWFGWGSVSEGLCSLIAHQLPIAGEPADVYATMERAHAALMLNELRQVIPAFLTRVDQPNRGGATADFCAGPRVGD